MTLLWLSTTPRGTEVLPDVYWRKQVSSSAAAMGRATALPRSRTSGVNRSRRSGASARAASTSARNQSMVTTARASQLWKTLALSSESRVG